LVFLNFNELFRPFLEALYRNRERGFGGEALTGRIIKRLGRYAAPESSSPLKPWRRSEREKGIIDKAAQP
jgi:hypothetical protein